MRTETLTERQALAVGNITTLNSTSMNTGTGINMGVIKKARAFFHVGTQTNGSALTLTLQASATSGGSFAAITGLTINPSITVPANIVVNTLYSLEITSDLMPSGKPWLIANAQETGGQNVQVDIILVGDESDFCPVMTVAGAAAQSPNLSTATLTTATVAHV